MWLPTQGQVNAAVRHLITIAGTAITIFGLQAKGYDIATITASIQALGETVNSILVLIGAIAGAYAAFQAANSASPKNQIASVQALATGDRTQQQEAATTLIEATAAVAASPGQMSRQAKVALLDATAAQPEVIGQIHVTDAGLAHETNSTQVTSSNTFDTNGD